MANEKRYFRGGAKRSLSMPQRAARSGFRGDPDLGKAARDALRVANTDTLVLESLTHPLHTYPARMHPATARALVELAGEAVAVQGADTEFTILDPFCGGGTTLVEGRAAGAHVIGVDANPLAVSLARTKVWATSKPKLVEFGKLVKTLSTRAMLEVKAARRANYEPAPARVIPGVNPVEREKALKGWFGGHVRRELEFLAGLVDEVDDAHDRERLWVLISSILYKVSKRRSDTDNSKSDRQVARGAASRLFAQRGELLVAGLEDLRHSPRASAPGVYVGDARALHKSVHDVSALISSPPYPGTYDYTSHHDLRMAFLGIDTRSFTRREIGPRRSFRSEQGLHRWREDFGRALSEGARTLADGGLMFLVMGDSRAGDVVLYADEQVASLLPKDYRIIAQGWQHRTKLGTRERELFGRKAKCERILVVGR